MGRLFPEICFRSFALEFSQPSARSFALCKWRGGTCGTMVSSNWLSELRAGFSHTGGVTSSLPAQRRIGQRGRCPSRCEGESRATGTLPLPCEGESQKPSLSRKFLPNLPNFSTNESYGVSQSMLKRRMQVCDDFLSRRNIKISQEVV